MIMSRQAMLWITKYFPSRPVSVGRRGDRTAGTPLKKVPGTSPQLKKLNAFYGSIHCILNTQSSVLLAAKFKGFEMSFLNCRVISAKAKPLGMLILQLSFDSLHPYATAYFNSQPLFIVFLTSYLGYCILRFHNTFQLMEVTSYFNIH